METVKVILTRVWQNKLENARENLRYKKNALRESQDYLDKSKAKLEAATIEIQQIESILDSLEKPNGIVTPNS